MRERTRLDLHNNGTLDDISAVLTNETVDQRELLSFTQDVMSYHLVLAEPISGRVIHYCGTILNCGKGLVNETSNSRHEKPTHFLSLL